MRYEGQRLVCIVGVEGVMRSCCEKTMGVLRQNKESLITIIEVLNTNSSFWYSAQAWRMLDNPQKICCSPAFACCQSLPVRSVGQSH